jgi:hypothetical protein
MNLASYPLLKSRLIMSLVMTTVGLSRPFRVVSSDVMAFIRLGGCFQESKGRVLFPIIILTVFIRRPMLHALFHLRSLFIHNSGPVTSQRSARLLRTSQGKILARVDLQALTATPNSLIGGTFLPALPFHSARDKRAKTGLWISPF